MYHVPFSLQSTWRAHLGADISYIIATDSQKPEKDKNVSIVPLLLSYAQKKRIEQFLMYTVQAFTCIGQLTVLDRQTLFGDNNAEEVERNIISIQWQKQIHEAVEKQNCALVSELCVYHSEGGDINAPCPQTGLTVLHKAIERGNEDIVKVLLLHGSNVQAKSTLYDGDSALELAKRFDQLQIKDLLDQM